MMVLTFLLFFISITMLAIKYKSLINPVVMIFCYFYGVLFFANTPILGLAPPSQIGSAFFILSFSSALIGALVANRRSHVPDDSAIESNKRLCFFAFLILCVFPLSIVALKGALYIVNSGYESYVIEARFKDDVAGVVGSDSLVAFINLVSRPISRAALFIGVALFFVGKGKGMVAIGAFSLAAFSFVFVKRMDLAVIVFVFFV